MKTRFPMSTITGVQLIGLLFSGCHVDTTESSDVSLPAATVAIAAIKKPAETLPQMSPAQGLEEALQLVGNIEVPDALEYGDRLERVLVFTPEARFESGTAAFVAAEQTYDAMREVLTAALQYTNADVIVEGYADELNVPELNRKLALSRAEAIAGMLRQESGVETGRLIVMGFDLDSAEFAQVNDVARIVVTLSPPD